MKHCRILLILISGITSMTLYSQNFNRPIPVGLMCPYEFDQFDTTDYGYYITAPFKVFEKPGNICKPRAMMLDKDGYIAWFSSNDYPARFYDFKYHPNAKMFSCCYGPKGRLILDSSFNITRQINGYDNMTPDMHDFQILSNGNVLFCGKKDSLMNLSAWTFNGIKGSKHTVVVELVLFELDTANNLVFQWNHLKYIQPTMTYDIYGYDSTLFDYCHVNSIDEDSDGNLILSFRHINAVYKINHKTGKVIWQLGGKSSSFKFTNDIGFTAQHDVRHLPGSTYSLYDNTDSSVQKTRAVIYSLDTMNWTAKKIWEYKPDPAFFAGVMGNYQVTTDFNHLINYGSELRPYPSMDFVNNNGVKISQIFFTDSVKSYRSFIYKLPFSLPRPIITLKKNKVSDTLYAPPGFKSYVWSTGETSDHIAIKQSGVYQVWVNYGIGMLGSKPYDYNQKEKSLKLKQYEEKKERKN